MRIRINRAEGRPRQTVRVQPDRQPTVVRPAGEDGAAVTLNWDRAVDDEGHLRRCVVCGGKSLYASKPIPRLTPFVLVILAAVVAILLWGTGQVAWAVAVLAVVLLVDLLIWKLVRPKLVCYACGSEYLDLTVRPGHPRWDAERARDAG